MQNSLMQCQEVHKWLNEMRATKTGDRQPKINNTKGRIVPIATSSAKPKYPLDTMEETYNQAGTSAIARPIGTPAKLGVSYIVT
jgi:hypothetical protein